MNLAFRSACLAAVLSGAMIAQTDPVEPKLAVAGDVSNPGILTKADLAKLPRTTVTVMDHGAQATYQGVALYQVLKRAGAPLDEKLTGKALATYVLADARDGYRAVYAIAEVDPAFTDLRIIVADAVDGKPLAANQGPLRMVVPGDKKAARSVRMLEKITVVQLGKTQLGKTQLGKTQLGKTQLGK